ncbi:MAG TPA: hypothetical protein VIN59_00660 [Alphaproteobacteria bacterium]
MKFDLASLKRYASPHAYKDLDVFLEQLPMRAGHGVIIAGVVAWVIAGLAMVYVVMQANHVMALRADILKAEALKPTVPVISEAAVDAGEVEAFTKLLTQFYPQLNFIAAGNKIEIRSDKTEMYGAFREAAGHIFNGGVGWRAKVDDLCVGRECKIANGNTALYGAFTISRLSVVKPGA